MRTENLMPRSLYKILKMKKNITYFKLLLILPLLLPLHLAAQTIPVGMPVLESAYRRAQLLGKINPHVSFTSRPLFPSQAFGIKNIFYPDSLLAPSHVHNKKSLPFPASLHFAKGNGNVQLLPVIWQNQYNSIHPAGYNDGAMVPAKGYQSLLSAGVYVRYKFISIQFAPQWLYVENKPFPTFYQIYHKSTPPENIDLPERFGDSTFQKINWGNSSIRFTYGPVSLGLSNENMWWGPGIHNSLLMTNNAPGFMHLTLNTVKPIRTPIGSFEGQLIGGKLEPSGYTKGQPGDWVYLNALTGTWQPKWVPGLFLGFVRSFMIYHKDMGPKVYDYLPVFGSLLKAAVGNKATDARRQDQLISVFMRWLWVKAKGEVYVEFGREDHAWNLRDLILEPNHSAAWIIGVNKLFSLPGRKGEYLQINAEVTNLASNSTTNNRDRGNNFFGTGTWYTHSDVRQGYTNRGQVLGAGIGPGSNSQWVKVAWVKGLRSIGLEFERYVHNNDYFVSKIKDARRNWVDLTFGVSGNWQWDHWLLNVQAQYIHELNYEWVYRPAYIFNYQPTYWSPTKDTYNIHARMAIIYRF